MDGKNIIIYDGECNFCAFWVNYVINRDKKGVFYFVSLQSEKAKELFKVYKIDISLDTLVLIENNSFYIKSTAALHILKTLGGFKSIFYGLRIFPVSVRDFCYDIIAKNRYKWFGKSSCKQ